MAQSDKETFWKNKIEWVFKILYDKNSDGKINKDDFEEAISKMTKVFKWETDGRGVQEATKKLNSIWTKLKERADKNNDDVVSKEEWLNLWTECVNSKDQELPSWQSDFMDFMFRVNDTSDDKLIDKEEYTKFWAEVYGIDEKECNKAFDKISAGKTHISKEDFEQLWKDYFLCKDKTAKGNYLFGVPEFLQD